MKNEEFLRIVEETKRNLFVMQGDFRGYLEKKEKYRAIGKIIDAIEFFHLEIRDNSWNIYYDNYIVAMAVIYQKNDQRLVFPLMILYTNISYYTLRAKPFVSKNTYERLCGEKKKIGEAIRQICYFDFENVIFNKEKHEKIKKFIEFSIRRLYHCIENIGEYSTEVVEEDAKKLEKIRRIYQSFQIKNEVIVFYDEILGKRVKIATDSPQSAYAVSMLFCRAYVGTVSWLKKQYPSGQWCPVVPWSVLEDFRVMLEKMYHK